MPTLLFYRGDAFKQMPKTIVSSRELLNRRFFLNLKGISDFFHNLQMQKILGCYLTLIGYC